VAPQCELHRFGQRRLEEQGVKAVDERAIFEGRERMREIEEKAVGTTKAVRRAAQRRRRGLGALAREVGTGPKPSDVPAEDVRNEAPEDILPFDELDDMT